MPKPTTQKQIYEEKITEIEGLLNKSEIAIQEKRKDIATLRACIAKAAPLDWILKSEKGTGWDDAGQWYIQSRKLL